jgi:hypothetical protein
MSMSRRAPIGILKSSILPISSRGVKVLGGKPTAKLIVVITAVAMAATIASMATKYRCEIRVASAHIFFVALGLVPLSGKL